MNLLNVSLLVDGTSVLVEVDRLLDVLAETLDEADVDIRLHESLANLFQHLVDDLS